MNGTTRSVDSAGMLSAEISTLVSDLNAVFGPSLVATMSGSKDSKAPIRWAKAGSTMRADRERNLRFAHRIMTTVSAGLDARTVRTWFLISNPLLDESSPIDAIGAGNHLDVAEAARQFVESSASEDRDLSHRGSDLDGHHSVASDAGDLAPTHLEATDPSWWQSTDDSRPMQSPDSDGKNRSTATMRDVAQMAGVSIKTVSNVVNGSARVRESTQKRVEEAVEALGYQVNVSARNLRQGRTGMIGLIVPDLRVPYFAELAYSVLQAVEERGLTLLIEQSGSEGANESKLLRSPRRRFTDGLLFSPVALDPTQHPELDVDYPLVLLGERVFDSRFDHVTMANVEAAKAATTYLASLGCKNIAVLGYHPDEVMGSARLRYEGYRLGLEEAGLEFDARLVGEAGRWVRSTGHDAMKQVLDSGASIDGVFAMNDALALGALKALRSRGLRVPQDIAVIGFDDIDDAQYSDPPLSSIDPGRNEIAEQAVALLMAKMAGSDEAPQQVVANFSLVERASTLGS